MRKKATRGVSAINVDTIGSHTNTSFVILSIILYFFELIIILVVCKFFHLLKDLLDTEIKFLRTDSTVQKQFICNC